MVLDENVFDIYITFFHRRLQEEEAESNIILEATGRRGRAEVEVHVGGGRWRQAEVD